jgi:antitoxin ParD1/3/4
MPTRNVVLSEHQHELVETLVQSGRYQNASEVLREGLRLIEERERIGQAKLKALEQAARQGWADVSAGRYADVADDRLEDFVGQLGRRAAQLAKTASRCFAIGCRTPSRQMSSTSLPGRTSHSARPRGCAMRA